MLKYRLKNYFTAFAILFSSSLIFGQLPERKPDHTTNSTSRAGDFIDVNVPPYLQSSYNMQQLVTEVLVSSGSTCATPQVSNIVVSPNLPVTDVDRPWGYFNKGTATFPFAEGIVLSTGFARKAGNAFESSNGDNLTTNGDTDLATAINVNNSSLNDAVYLEFDFIPTSTQLKFNYIFASEEYTGGFPCNYSDGFALLLKPAGGTYTNIAVLPAGAGAVSVTNVRPSTMYTGGALSCGAMNPTYFAGYNNPITGHNFNGSVIPLTAQATVIPGQSYHIKMVLADFTDSSFDSAVFLEAGSFDIGVQIVDPSGVALPSEVHMCDLVPQSLTASVQVTGATYQWFLNGQQISGATNPTYLATQPGVYSIEVWVPGNQCPGEATVTILGGTSPTVQNATLTQCYGPGNVSFNLTLANIAMSATPGVNYTYYENLVDAQANNNNFISNPLAFMSAGNQTVYVVVKSGFCPKIAELQLVKAPEMIADIAQPPGITCVNPQVTLNATSSIYPSGSVFQWVASGGGYIFSGANTLTPVVASGGVYTLTIVKAYQPGDVVCTATAAVTVQENITPPSVTLVASDTLICAGESVILSATGGTSYVWSTNASPLNTIIVSPSVTTTYSVYAVGDNGCQSTNPATVLVEVVPAVSSILPTVSGQICVGDRITLDAGANPQYTYLWNTGETTQTISVNAIGTYSVLINNGVCSATFNTEVIQAQVPQVANVDIQANTITVTANNPSNGVLEYSINDGFTWQDSNVFTNVPTNVSITILVRVKNTSCTGSLEYFTLYVQNVITPNNDGVNDELNLEGISRYTNFAASVYDRYGKEIWKGSKTQPNWNGRFQSKILPTSTYWYRIAYDDPATKKLVEKSGWIMLKNRE